MIALSGAGDSRVNHGGNIQGVEVSVHAVERVGCWKTFWVV